MDSENLIEKSKESDKGKSNEKDKDKEKDKVQLLFILKWGGELTHSGGKQAEQLGEDFRR